MTKLRSAAAAALATALAGGAGSLTSCANERPVPKLPAAVVEVTITEYHFAYRQPVPAGRVVFRVVNAGRQLHRVSVVALPKDLPPIMQQLRGTKRRGIVPFASIGGLRPGTGNSFAVDLAAGQRYALLDVESGPDGRSNALLGLASEFRAGGGLAGPSSG